MTSRGFAAISVLIACLLTAACASSQSETSDTSVDVKAKILECRQSEVPLGPSTSRTYTAAYIQFLVTNTTDAPMAIEVEGWNISAGAPLIVPPGDSVHKGARKGVCPQAEILDVISLNQF